MFATGSGTPRWRFTKRCISGPSLSTNSVLSAANARKKKSDLSPSRPAATPLSSVVRISGAAFCTSCLALCGLSMPRSLSQPWILFSDWFIFVEMSPELADMPPKTRQKMSTPMATSPSRTRIAPAIRGTLWPSSQPTAGPATAPSTAARITGMTIVDVSASSQMIPTMISTKPTSSHDEMPRSLSHVGAAD